MGPHWKLFSIKAEFFQINSLMIEVKFPCFYYICMSVGIDFYGRLTARIATLALGFDPKGMKPSDIQYEHSYH